jgi:hypothetical protein
LCHGKQFRLLPGKSFARFAPNNKIFCIEIGRQNKNDIMKNYFLHKEKSNKFNLVRTEVTEKAG